MTKSSKTPPLFDFASHILSILSQRGPESNLNLKARTIRLLHADKIFAKRSTMIITSSEQ